jgi:2-oxoglutarate ferredoxin oxidoreductase subunit gamma
VRQEVRISGFGGQGVALAGFVLGKALSLSEGLEVVMTQSYGPEARGGASSSNLVIADKEINYPLVQDADVLVIFSQEGYTKYRPQVKPDAIVFIDEDLVTISEKDEVHRIPATKIAEELGRRIVANMVMLGYLTAITGLAKRESMEESIKTTVREKTVPLNLKAFAAGYEYAPEKEMADE